MKVNPNSLLFIVDFKEVIQSWSLKNKMYDLYSIFPLQDIICTILYMSAYEDHNELFWIEFENRLSACNRLDDKIDFEKMSVFLESITQDVDSVMNKNMSHIADYGVYSFDKWIDSTSALLVNVNGTNFRPGRCS